MFLGISVWEFIEVDDLSGSDDSPTSSSGTVVSIPFAMAMLMVLILGRMLTATSLFAFSSSYLGSEPLSKNEQITFAFGGSVRGSIAFAQALQLQAWGIESNNIIVSTAVLLCMVTSVLSGFVLPWLITVPTPPAPGEELNIYSCSSTMERISYAPTAYGGVGYTILPSSSLSSHTPVPTEESKGTAAADADTATAATHVGVGVNGATGRDSSASSTKSSRSASVFSPTRYFQNMDTGMIIE